MEPIEKLADLDAKGIVPASDDTPEDYLFRGHRTITRAHDLEWMKDFMRIYAVPEIKKKLVTNEIRFPVHRTPMLHAFREGIAECGRMTHTDLSWVPLFAFDDEGRESRKRVLGISLRYPSREPGVRMLLMGFNPMLLATFDPIHAKGTGAHEAFHTVRHSIVPVTAPKVSEQSEQYEHLGDRMILTSWRWKYRSEPYEKDFLNGWLKMCWCFGIKNAWYVLVRLTYDEIRHRRPKQYLRSMAKTSLRHRIMCHRLGL